MTIFICIVQCTTYFKAIKNQVKMIFCFQYHPETTLPSSSSKGLSNNTYLRSVRVHLQFCPLSKLEMDLDWPVIPFHCTFSTNFSPHLFDIGSVLTMTAELLGRGTGTATLRYRQSSLCLVFGFHISAPGNPGNIMSTIWIQELGRRKASLVPDQLKKWRKRKKGFFYLPWKDAVTIIKI